MNIQHEVSSFEELAKKDGKVRWLNEAIKKSLVYMDTKKHRNKRFATMLKLLVVLLSGTGTILLGLQITDYEKMFKDLAFVLVSLVTLFNALEPFFNFRSLWVEQETAMAGFHRLQDDLEFYLSGRKNLEQDDPQIDEFYKRYQAVWGTHNEAWAGFRAQNAGGITYL